MTNAYDRITILVDRADAQLQELRRDLEVLDAAGHPILARTEFTETDAISLTVESVGQVDDALEMTFVEAVGNIRKALDRAVAQMAVKSGQIAMEQHRGAFPIYSDRAAYFKPNKAGIAPRDHALANVPEPAKIVVDSLQPFTSPGLHPLRLLQELSNEDKHRGGHPSFVALRGAALMLRDDMNVRVYELPVTLPPIGSRRAIEPGPDLFADLPPQALEPLHDFLKNGGSEDDTIVALRTGVAFGPKLVLLPEVEDILEFVRSQVIAALKPHI